jgi:hypothetical protein
MVNDYEFLRQQILITTSEIGPVKASVLHTVLTNEAFRALTHEELEAQINKLIQDKLIEPAISTLDKTVRRYRLTLDGLNLCRSNGWL